MDKKEVRKLKLSKENATGEFHRICDYFNFNISTEVKTRTITMDMNNIPMAIQQDIVDADAFINKIVSGKIEFDEDRKEIVYKLNDPILTGENKEISTKEFRFGKFNRAKQMGSGIPLNKCNFASLDDQDQNKLIAAMTCTSDLDIINQLDLPDFNDLRMIGGYFFN